MKWTTTRVSEETLGYMRELAAREKKSVAAWLHDAVMLLRSGAREPDRASFPAVRMDGTLREPYATYEKVTLAVPAQPVETEEQKRLARLAQARALLAQTGSAKQITSTNEFGDADPEYSESQGEEW